MYGIFFFLLKQLLHQIMKINEKNLSSFASGTTPAPEKQGYLMKRGESNKALQKRWLVLKGNLLFYYEKQTDREPIGVIILHDCTVRPVESEEAYMFEIAFRGSESQAYAFGASTQQEMESWIRVLMLCTYEHTKTLLKELQHQLDELNALKSGSIAGSSSSVQQHHRGHLPSEGNSCSLLKKSSASSAESETVSHSIDISSPVDTEALDALHLSMPRKSDDSPRNFLEMHHDFGENIRLKQKIVLIRFCENSFLKFSPLVKSISVNV